MKRLRSRIAQAMPSKDTCRYGTNGYSGMAAGAGSGWPGGFAKGDSAA